jgi:hypothetical protein
MMIHCGTQHEQKNLCYNIIKISKEEQSGFCGSSVMNWLSTMHGTEPRRLGEAHKLQSWAKRTECKLAWQRWTAAADQVSPLVFEYNKNITVTQVKQGNSFQTVLPNFSQAWEQLMSF